MIGALQLIRYLNSHNQYIVVHGANLSLSIPHVIESYACGGTPVCNECARLVGAGVTVVAAAGNNGYHKFQTATGEFPGYATLSITDPGNAEDVITVGATHRRDRHTYGIPISRAGTTGEAVKPIWWPGEAHVKPAPVVNGTLAGTSQSAAHVSAAARDADCALSGTHRSPRRSSDLCESATTSSAAGLQGHGLLDTCGRCNRLTMESAWILRWKRLPARYWRLLMPITAPRPAGTGADRRRPFAVEEFLEPRSRRSGPRGAGFGSTLLVSHTMTTLCWASRFHQGVRDPTRARPYPVREAWFNSFERISNAKDIGAVTASVTASTGAAALDEIDLEEQGIDSNDETRAGLKVLASVNNGKRLRDDVKALNLPTNTGFGGLVRRRRAERAVQARAELKLHIAAPLPDQLTACRDFAKDLKPEAALAAYTDGSVPNCRASGAGQLQRQDHAADR